MKNQIDQSTPFLAFYDLLRIRGIYSTEEKREKLRRGFRRAMALAAVFVGVFAAALPSWALPGGLAGDSRVSTSGTTMTISPNLGANAGSDFSWDSFNVAGNETVTIDATSIHTAPSFDVAGLVDAGSNVLVFKTPGGNIAVSGEVKAGRFFAATFDGFNKDDMHFAASAVPNGDINITGTIPSDSVLVGNTISASGAAATAVATAGMLGTSDITIASGGGTITFVGTTGAGSVLKAGTVNMGGSTVAGDNTTSVSATGEITGDFSQSAGSVEASALTGKLTQSGGVAAISGTIASLEQTTTAIAGTSATAANITTLVQNGANASATATTAIGALTQTAGTATGSVTGDATVGGTLTAASIGGKATVSGTLNGVSGLSVGSLEQTGGSIAANGAITINGSATQTGGAITATGTALAADTADVSLSQAGNTLGTVSGAAGNVTLNGSALTVGALTASGKLTLNSDATVGGGNIVATEVDAGTRSFTHDGAGSVTVSGAGGIKAATITQTANAGTISASKLDGVVTQNGGTISGAAQNGNVQITGVLDQNAGNISLGTGTLTLEADSTVAGNVTAGKIDAGTHKFTQDGAGTVTVSGSDGIKAATITQTANAGTISASKLDGAVIQNGGTIQANNATDGLTLTQAIATQNGTLSGNGGNITLTDGSTLSGTVNAATLNGNFTQANGTITATTVAGAVTQNGGTIKNDNGSLTFESDITQSSGGTIGSATTDVAFEKSVELTEGAVIADTVTLGKDGTSAGAITLNSLSANTLQGTAGAVTVNNSGAIQLGALTASSLDVTAGGAITQNGGITVTGDDGASFSGTSITLTRTDNNIGTENGNTLGAKATDGDVKIVNNGAIRICGGHTVSGKNVSLEALGDEGYIFLDKRTVDPAHAVVSATDGDNGTITLTSHGALGQGLPTTGIYQGTGAGVAAKNLVVHAAKDDGTALDVALNRDGDSNVNSVQTLSGNGGAVSIKTATALELGALNVESLDAKANGNITQTGATTLSGTGEKNVTLDAGTGTINLSQGVSGAGTLTLLSNASAAGVITAAKIDATGKTLTQNGAGTITVSGADGIVASQVSQTYNGTEGARSTIRADKIEADFVQTGSYAAVDAFTENGTLDIKGNVSQNADNGVIGSSSTNVQLGDTGKPLDQDKGTINAKELLLRENSTSADTIYAERITLQRSTGTWLDLDQDGPGTITVTGAGITGSRIIQSSTGTIRTDRINDIPSGGSEPLPAEDGIGGRIDQTGAATLQAYNAENGLKIGGHLYQQNEGAVVGTDGEDVEIFGWAATEFLKQDAGTINARTLTIHGDSTAAGNIVAGKITGAGKLTQDGAGTIKAASGEIELDVAVEQNDDGATIGSTDTSVKVNKAFTQTAGKIEAATLTLNNAAKDYDYNLESAGNNVAKLSGTAKSVTLDNTARTGKLTLSGLSVGTGDGNTVTVKKAADVELAGVTAKEIIITDAANVTDSGTSVAAGSVKIDKSSAVTLDNAGTLTIAGIASSGAVVLDAGTIAQNGDVSGTTVSMTQTGTGDLALGNVTATGTGDAGTVSVTTRGGAISQQNGTAVTAPGAATFTAQNEAGSTTYDITVENPNNAFGSVGATGKDVKIQETDGVALNAISASKLTVTANGAISQNAAAEVTGATSVTVTDGSKVDLNNTANKFVSVGVVGKTADTGAAGEVTVVDSDGTLALDAIRASMLTVTANGEVSQNAAVEVTGATAVTVADGSKVDLNNDANRLGSVGVVGKTDKAGAVTVVDSDGTLALDAVKAASLDVAAAGAVSQNAAAQVAGATAVTVADGSKVDLNNAENKLGSVGVVGKTENTGAAGEVTVVDSDSTLALNAIRASKLTVTANGAVSQNAAAEVTGATAVTVANGSTVDLNNDANQLGSVGVAGKTGKAGAVTVVDSDGTLALDAVKAASLDVTANGGNISQTAAVDVTGTTTVTAQSTDGNTQYDIALANEGNQLEGKVTATGKDVSVADAKALELDVTAASVAATVTGNGNGARITSTQTADLEVKDISAAVGDVVIKTTGKANVMGTVSANGAGKGVAIVSTGVDGGVDGGVDITGNVSADKDIVVRADKAAVGIRKGTEAGALAPELATPNGAIVLKGKSVSVGEATLKAPTGTYGETPSDDDVGGIGIRATGTDGDGIVLSGSTLVAKNVVLDSAKDVTVGKFDDTDAGTKVAMMASEGGEAGSRLVIAAEGDVKGYFDSANRPTESIRIVKSKKISTGESVDIDEFALKTTEDIDEFTFNGSRLALESKGAVHVTVGGDDVTIFNNAIYGDKKTIIEASDVSADPADPAKTVKVEAGVDPQKAAGGLIGDSIDFKVADGSKTSVTVEENATVKSTKDLALTLPGSFTVASGAKVEGSGAVSVTAGGKVLVEGAKTVSENNVERQVAAAAVTGKSVALTTNGTGEKADDISIAGVLTTTGGGTTTLTSAKDIALSGAVTSAGKATLTAANGTVNQTAGSLQSAGLEITAKDIQQNGGAITATGATVATATDGSVKLDAKDTNNAAANDFETVKAVAKDAITIADKNTLTVSGAAGSDDGATATTGDIAITAAGNLTVSGPANAGGNALLEGTSIEVAETGSVTANGTGNALLKATASVGTVAAKGAVKGANVTLDAPNGVTTSANGTIEASAGDVYVHAGAGTMQIGANVTAAGHNAVFKADAGNVELSEGTVVDAVGVGLQGNGLAEVRSSNLGAGVRDLALVATAGGATLSGVPADVGNIGISVTGGDLVVTASGDRTFNGATVNASAVGGDGTAAARAPETGVTAAGLSSVGNNASLDVTITDGTITVGNVTASGDATITATDGAIVANGNVTAGGAATIDAATTVTAGAIDANGGAATVTAGGAVTAASITGAQGTTVNAAGQAVAVAGQLGEGGATQVTAATLNAGSLASGGDTTLNVGGEANVGQLNVGGDLNGTVGGTLTTTGGNTGSIGQGGGFNVGGDFTIDGDLDTGAFTAEINGDLNVNGAVAADDVELTGVGAVNLDANFEGGDVNIQADSIAGGGTLAADALTLAIGGDIGNSAADRLTVDSANLASVVAGGNLYLVDTAAGPIAVTLVQAGGDADVDFGGANVVAGGGGGRMQAGGNLTIAANGTVGTLQNPITVQYGGRLTVNGTSVNLLHIVIDGDIDPLTVDYVGNGFAIWHVSNGYQIVGTSPENRRLINRALAFTVNTPELKSKQGVFGDPAFVHTKMNVSEARSIGNMDVLALNDVDYRRTWSEIIGNTANFELDWKPAVFVSENPLNAKLKSVQAESETQPEIYRFQRRMAAPATAPAPVTAVR